MPLGAHQIAFLKADDIAAHRHDLAYEFMPCHGRNFNGLLRPVIPVIYMHIRAANAGFKHFNQHIVDAVRRLRYVKEPDALFGFGFY